MQAEQRAAKCAEETEAAAEAPKVLKKEAEPVSAEKIKQIMSDEELHSLNIDSKKDRTYFLLQVS